MKDTSGIAATYKGSLYDSTYIASTKRWASGTYSSGGNKAEQIKQHQKISKVSRKWPSNYTSRGIAFVLITY